MPRNSPEKSVVKMSGFIKRQSQELLYKLNQLVVSHSDDILHDAEGLCEQAEKVRAAVCDYFDIEEGA
ncbi:MAG: Rop family plasmid primer RNA-binding protein [Gammaproteobacteria bacterium]|nr:Rop family plasmid primer RNA-binding protein [Gammaproteobacteria bacterium]